MAIVFEVTYLHGRDYCIYARVKCGGPYGLPRGGDLLLEKAKSVTRLSAGISEGWRREAAEGIALKQCKKPMKRGPRRRHRLQKDPIMDEAVEK